MSPSRRTPNVYSAVPTPMRISAMVKKHAHRGQRVNLAETYRRDRRDRLVQGVDKSEPEDHIAHSPGNDHQPKR